MNTAELAEHLANSRSMTKADARSIIETVFAAIVDEVHAGNDVALAGIGKFALKQSPERDGRNPANGQPMKIKAQRKITFTPAKAIKDKLNA